MNFKKMMGYNTPLKLTDFAIKQYSRGSILYQLN